MSPIEKFGTMASKNEEDRKSTRLNSSHSEISYAVFCLKKKIAIHLLAAHTRPQRYFALSLHLLPSLDKSLAFLCHELVLNSARRALFDHARAGTLVQ